MTLGLVSTVDGVLCAFCVLLRCYVQLHRMAELLNAEEDEEFYKETYGKEVFEETNSDFDGEGEGTCFLRVQVASSRSVRGGNKGRGKGGAVEVRDAYCTKSQKVKEIVSAQGV